MKKVFTDLEEFELSPKIDSKCRKMSFSGPTSYRFERKYSQKTLTHHRTVSDEKGGEHRSRASTDPVNFEKCKIRRKLSFPSTVDPLPKCEGKMPKKKDTTLLALIFKKQASFDVKKEGKEAVVDKGKDNKDNKNKSRKIPDFSFSNPVSLGVESQGLTADGKCSSDVGLNECKTGFDSGRVGSTPKVMSRSCGQVEIISCDPAVRENFLRATMSIFLAVSPPSSKIQVKIQIGVFLFVHCPGEPWALGRISHGFSHLLALLFLL